jgi:hypothetical protein
VRFVVAVLLLIGTWDVIAQTATEPALHQRGSGSGGTTAGPSIPGGKQRGTSTLPAMASGEYMLDETGSVVQITIENGILDGYISKLVEGQTSTITYFFDRTTINGNHLTFTTRQIHGLWFSFDGAIMRGDASSKRETGYYRLKGMWLTHDEVGKGQSTSNVSLKSTPREESRFPAN